MLRWRDEAKDYCAELRSELLLLHALIPGNLIGGVDAFDILSLPIVDLLDLAALIVDNDLFWESVPAIHHGQRDAWRVRLDALRLQPEVTE